MKFPKLKNTVLCMLTLFFPAGALFWYLIVMIMIHGWDAELNTVEVIGLMASIVFSLWYLLRPKRLFLLMTSGGLFSAIQSWKRDRLEYRTFRNGHSRDEVEKRILKRCRLWGRQFNNIKGSEAERFRIYYRHCTSWSALISGIEKRVAVCSVDHLTADDYSALISKAVRLLKQIPNGKLYFKTPSEKKAPRTYAYVVVILANRVDDEVRSLARKTRIAKENEYLLPCVSECPSGTYYLDGGREIYAMKRPAKNYALSLLGKLVFAGHWPLKDKTQLPPIAFEADLDMSLWEYIRDFNKMMRKTKSGSEKERKKMFRSLSNGDVRIGEFAIYYKNGELLIECAYLLDEENEKLISYSINNYCYILKSEFPYTVNKRKLKKEQIIEADKRIENYLILEGYRIQEEDESSY